MVKGELSDLLKREAPLTAYELGRIMESAAKLMKEMPLAALRTIAEPAKYGVEEVEKAARMLADRLVNLQREFDIMASQVYEASEQGYAKIKEAKSLFEKRVSGLPSMAVPQIYGLKELVDVAEHCSRLDDSQWQRVIDLAKALNK